MLLLAKFILVSMAGPAATAPRVVAPPPGAELPAEISGYWHGSNTSDEDPHVVLDHLRPDGTFLTRVKYLDPGSEVKYVVLAGSWWAEGDEMVAIFTRTYRDGVAEDTYFSQRYKLGTHNGNTLCYSEIGSDYELCSTRVEANYAF